MTDPLKWRISTYSTNGGSCVAVAETPDGVMVRNSNAPGRCTLDLDAGAMAAFVAASKAGEFDDLT